MKKIFIAILFSAFSLALVAQDKGSDLKNMRFGVTVLPALNWYKPADPKKFSSEGVVPRIGVLINGEYSFGSNFAIGFGLGIASMGGKISFTDSVRYAIDDDKILGWKDSTKTSKSYLLRTREYKASYFLLPISLKMRTNEIGYMRYFVEPRLNIGIRKNVRADDDVTDWRTTDKVSKLENLNINTDMAPINLSVTISGGAEYYLSGSTAFVFALGYQYGLSNTVKGTSDYLERFKNTKLPTNAAYTGTGKGQQLEEKFTQNGLVLSLGILF